jgi:hypothetical protein
VDPGDAALAAGGDDAAGLPDDPAMIWLLLAQLAQLAATQPTTQASQPVETEEHHDALFTTAAFDAGHDFSYGLGALYAKAFSAGRGGLGAFTWIGAGLEGRLSTHNHTSLDGVIIDVPIRWELAADAGGAGIEVRLGLGSGAGSSLHGVGSVGVFWGVYYFDIGYSYQFPLGPFDRPDWMASHQFSIRVNVPVAKWNKHETTRR